MCRGADGQRCSLQLNADPLAAVPTYSYDLQYTDAQIEDRGVASSRDILAAFDAFDWAGQVEVADRLQRCSPTFSVRDRDADRQFWVSGAGEPGKISFVNEYTYQGEVRRLFGLSRGKGSVSAPTRALSPHDARRAVELFVRGDHDALLRHLRDTILVASRAAAA